MVICMKFIALMLLLHVSLGQDISKTSTILEGMGSYECGKTFSSNVYRIAVLMPFDPEFFDQPEDTTKSEKPKVHEPTINMKDGPPYLVPSAEIAQEKIERLKASGQLSGMGNYTLKLFWGDTHCDIMEAMRLMFYYLLDEPVHAFIGPMCIYPLAAVIRFVGTRFHRPIVVYGGGQVLVSKPPEQLVTRLMVNYDSTTDLLITCFKEFRWLPRNYINIGLLASESDRMHGTRILSRLRHTTLYKVEAYTFKDYVQNELENRLISLAKLSRIVVLCADPDSVRKIMMKAYDLNFINGEYVFFNIDLFSSKDQSLKPWFRVNDTKPNNDKAEAAYRALMTVTLRKPDSTDYKAFSTEVKKRAAEHYGYTYGKEDVNSFVGAFHDAVLLYALALNDTLAENKTIEDGVHITKKMWNRTFEGITGNVSIDENGDRNADYSLLDMDPKSGEFRVVANYFGNQKNYVMVQGMDIDWINADNKPPPDTPKCGFDNSKCPKDALNVGVIASVVMGIVVAICMIAGFFIYRRTKFQAELRAMNWILPWDCIETTEKRRRRQSEAVQVRKQRRLTRQEKPDANKAAGDGLDMGLNTENHYMMAEREPLNSKGRKIGNDYDSDCDTASYVSMDTIAGIQLDNLQGAQLFNKTALYKGNVVALKAIVTNRKIETNKEMLIEVKKVKDLNNDHICRFIGACLEPPNQCIVTEYCPKGSLQDVLENDQINLDWMFKFSLMQDIVRGMIYLHNNLGPHGNLKSSNCLVDSRFVLKITDFGLHLLRGYSVSNEALLDTTPYVYYRNLLWTAPETLRQFSPTSFSLATLGTLKGDVYSFAIVCQEIVYRQGVFYLESDRPEPQQIVEAVKEGHKKGGSVLRPTLHSQQEEVCAFWDDLVRIISQAWEEDPLVRPDFGHIKVMMRKLNKGGDAGNILDNLLSRMEQYANNLEGLVAQRTEQYFEEKRKTEDLLYSMLPKSVAGQLIREEPVQAESFEMVTIYFSDIVGFTAISAESTPMQVIELLNRLYTTFDSIIENYDTYKVETIGDAYMVCSGLPQRNGDLHAREIARMSLSFLKAIFTFQIPHRKDKQLELRIGIHSGPVCSGVVGLKMPRYCLFGDTVNTSSRMESNGLPLKIHVSQKTMEVLQTFGNFIMAERGYIEMKGKGSQLTYWLHGEGNDIVDPIPEGARLVSSHTNSSQST